VVFLFLATLGLAFYAIVKMEDTDHVKRLGGLNEMTPSDIQLLVLWRSWWTAVKWLALGICVGLSIGSASPDAFLPNAYR
jgi:hypothetical protein